MQKQPNRWARHQREQNLISHEVYKELCSFFLLPEHVQSRPAKLSEGQRMTSEAYAAWNRFRDERTALKLEDPGYQVPEWWGETNHNGIVNNTGDGKAKKRGRGRGRKLLIEALAEAMETPIGELVMETWGQSGDGDEDDDDEEGGVLLRVDEDESMEPPEPRTPEWQRFGDK